MNDALAASIVVTGRGAVLATGQGPEPLWRRLMAGESALSPLSEAQFAASRLGWFGAVPAEESERCFAQLAPKLRKFVTETSAWGLAAVQQALTEAGVMVDTMDTERIGLFTAQGDYRYPSLASFHRAVLETAAEGDFNFARFAAATLERRGADPFVCIKSLANNLLATVSLSLGLRGDCGAHVQDQSAAIAALQHASFSLRNGDCDLAVVVAAGSYLEPFTLTELYGLGRLSCCRDGARSLRPFDRDRDGTIPAEGAVALVLERREGALARGRSPQVELVGIGVRAGGTVGRREIYRECLARLPQVIAPALLIADGCGGREEDAAEIERIEGLVAALPGPVAVTCRASATGALGGTGLLADLVLATEVMVRQEAPPIGNLRHPAAAGPWIATAPRWGRFAEVAVLHSSDTGLHATALLRFNQE